MTVGVYPVGDFAYFLLVADSELSNLSTYMGVSRKLLKEGLGHFRQVTAVMWLQSAYSTNC